MALDASVLKKGINSVTKATTAVISFLGLAILLVLISCVSRPDSAKSEEDQLIVEEVRARLRSEPSLRQADIVVDCEQGVVTLRGIVDDVIDRNLAESMARGVEGVRSVRNWLDVRKRAPSIFFRRR